MNRIFPAMSIAFCMIHASRKSLKYQVYISKENPIDYNVRVFVFPNNSPQRLSLKAPGTGWFRSQTEVNLYQPRSNAPKRVRIRRATATAEAIAGFCLPAACCRLAGKYIRLDQATC